MKHLDYKGYTASMAYDLDDEILVGRVIGIKGFVGFHAETVAEFKKMFRETVDGYIAACEKRGVVPDKPSNGKILLRVSPDVHHAAIEPA
jgi:predicted HicB family RNase H-like nuclease